MPGMQSKRIAAAQRQVPNAMFGLLHAPGAECTPGQKTRRRNVDRNSKVPERTWPGKDFGVRAPSFGEVPLSKAEVVFGEEMGLFDAWPMRRVIKPAGTWESKNIHLLKRPSPFEGLLL